MQETSKSNSGLRARDPFVVVHAENILRATARRNGSTLRHSINSETKGTH